MDPAKVKVLRWVLGAVFIVAIMAGMVVVWSGNRPGRSRFNVFAAYPVKVWLLSNQEVAGLEFAYFVMSNRTDRPVRYLQDRKSPEPSYLLIERSGPDPLTSRITITNHNQSRMMYRVPADLAPHSSVPFTVRYPSDVSNAELTVNYWPSRTSLQSFLYNLNRQAVGQRPWPTDAYENITIEQPFKQ